MNYTPIPSSGVSEKACVELKMGIFIDQEANRLEATHSVERQAVEQAIHRLRRMLRQPLQRDTKLFKLRLSQVRF